MRLVLLGDPVAHSRSPVMHRAALASLGLEGSYHARRVDVAGMEAAAREMREGLLDGANITMPHKHLAFRLADVVDREAERAGSVNTWVPHPRGVAGYSTDVEGVREAWRRRGLPSHGPVLVLGSGGAAAAALIALEGRQLVVSARKTERAVEMVQRCDVDAGVAAWGQPLPKGVVVNCTPVGMRGEVLPEGVMDEAVGLFDMAYGTEATPAVEEARARGLPHADGLDLLVAQAEASFRLWTGRESPEGVMEEAARNVSSTR